MTDYIAQLKEINVTLVRGFINAATKNTYCCDICSHTWYGTSASTMLVSHRKFGTNSCPECNAATKRAKSAIIRQQKLDILSSRGFKYINDDVKNNKKVLLEHVCGLQFTYNLYQENINIFQCKVCTTSTGKTITQVTPAYQEIMDILNIQLISPFTHRKDRHEFKCTTCDTEFTGVFNFKLNLTYPCPTCLNTAQRLAKLNTNYTERLHDECNITIVGEYIGAAEHHTLQCGVCDHVFKATPGSKIRAKKRGGVNYGKCPNCEEIQRNTHYNKIRAANIERVKQRGVILLQPDYNGSRHYKPQVLVKNINCGHKFLVTPANLFSNTNGVTCPICNIEVKREFFRYHSHLRSAIFRETASAWEIYRSAVASLTRRTYTQYRDIINPDNLPRVISGSDHGYQLDHNMSIRYCFDNTIPATICAHPSNLQMLPWLDNNSKKDKCGITPEVFCPILQHESIFDWFIAEVSTLTTDYVVSDDTAVLGYTLSVYFPKLKIALMLCMFKEYAQQYVGSTMYNYKLHDTALQSGIRVYQIYQDEWVSDHILILQKIQHLLGINLLTTRIHARSCTIKLITSSDRSKFLSVYHIQGSDRSLINIGAYSGEELVAVMTFNPPRILMNQRNSVNMEGTTYELSRFATNYNYRIPGIASKLLTYFERNYEYDYVYSFADIRWSDGNVYEQLGFTQAHINRPTYYYIVGGDRMHRWGFRKDMLRERFADFEPELTEYQNMLNHNFDRVWDCGTIKYIKYKA